MHAIHMKALSSTQMFLRQNLERLKGEDPNLLVSTEKQNKGKGRGEKPWVHFENSLAFSFTLESGPHPTLLTLETACHLCHFFSGYGENLSLKWPNDLLNPENIKVGGIIANMVNDTVIIGVGLNLFPAEGDPAQDFDFNYIAQKGDSFGKDFKERLPKEIYEFILSSRMDPKEINNDWTNLCAHRGKMVHIQESGQDHQGLFKGIGEDGEAILEGDFQDFRLYNGTLRF